MTTRCAGWGSTSLPGDSRGIANVTSYEQCRRAVDASAVARMHFDEAHINPKALRAWDLMAAVNSGRPSIDKNRHIMRNEQGKLVQHAVENLQITDVIYECGKFLARTSFEMDVYVDKYAQCLGPERVKTLLEAASRIVDGLKPESVLLSLIGMLGYESLRKAVSGLGINRLLERGDPLSAMRE